MVLPGWCIRRLKCPVSGSDQKGRGIQQREPFWRDQRRLPGRGRLSATRCRHGGSALVRWRRKVVSSQEHPGCRGGGTVHVLAPARPWLLSCHPALLRMLCLQADSIAHSSPASVGHSGGPSAWKSLLYVSKCQDHNYSSRSGSHRLLPPVKAFLPSLPPGSLFPAECPQHFSLMTVTLLCSSHVS